MSQIEALQAQVKDLRERLEKAEAMLPLLKEACLQVALGGQQLEGRVTAIEEDRRQVRNTIQIGRG